MPSLTLRVYDGPEPDSEPAGTLYDWTQVTRTRQHNGPGSLVVEYPRSGKSAWLLTKETAFIVPVVDGVESDTWYVLDEETDDEAVVLNHRTFTLTMPGVWRWLANAIVYPSGVAAGETGEAVAGHRPEHKYVDQTPGYILVSQLTRAQARGALAGLTWDFTSAVDSAGVAWPEVYDETYPAGWTLEQILDGMCEAGWIDARMENFTLRAFVSDTYLNNDLPDKVLRLGKDVTMAQRKRARLTSRSTMLVQGDGRALYEHVSTGTVTRIGRREGFYSRGGVNNLSTMRKLATTALATRTRVAEGCVVTYVPEATGVKPDVDYQVGDRIRFDQRRIADGSLEPMRVRTVTEQWLQGADRLYEVELNDLFAEQIQRLTQRLGGIRQGDPPTPSLPPAWPGLPPGIDPDDPLYQDIIDRIEDIENGAGGGWYVYVQPNEPVGAPVTAIWLDTDG